jgi:ATP-dependent RNA helicase DHX29
VCRLTPDVILKDLKAQRSNVGITDRLDVLPAGDGVSLGDNTACGVTPSASKLSCTVDIKDDHQSMQTADPYDSDNEGGVFGNLLDEVETSDEPTSTTVTVRSMPIPKQFAFGGSIPKTLLRTSLGKSSRQAIITYARLSSSRAARAGLEIRWSHDRRQVWRMDDIACDNMSEAENYVSTLALSELCLQGQITVNWKTLPPAFRDLWEELEAVHKGNMDVGKRLVWGELRSLLERKASPAPIVEVTKTLKIATQSQSAPFAPRTSSSTLQADFERRCASAPYRSMQKQRESLPIAAYRSQIIDILESSQILVLSGETGCGKSTQLPSFILEDQLAQGKPCKIYVTEPRRISAISLAQRVSTELGDAPGAMGTNSSLVGYSIRLEAKVSPATRLAFVTNGIALRMLESGPGRSGFDEITHIVVDEVHERSIESDFLLIVLKTLMEHRKDLKVVLMSATVDAEKISAFFGGCPFLTVPGRTFPVTVQYLEDAVELAGWHIDESSPYAVRRRNVNGSAKQLEWAESDSDEEEDPAKLSPSRYSARTVSTINLLDSRQIPYDLIVQLLEKLCSDPSLSAFSPATLIFMPGLAEIRKMNDMLLGHPIFGTGAFIVYPLHSTISSEGQSAVFDTPQCGVRKIVICGFWPDD